MHYLGYTLQISFQLMELVNRCNPDFVGKYSSVLVEIYSVFPLDQRNILHIAGFLYLTTPDETSEAYDVYLSRTKHQHTHPHGPRPE